jgi:hypothetical protein
MHSTPASIVTEIGRLRENVRGHVAIAVEAVDLVTITYYTGTHTETCVLSGEHWDSYAKAVANAERTVKRNRMRTLSLTAPAVEVAS